MKYCDLFESNNNYSIKKIVEHKENLKSSWKTKQTKNYRQLLIVNEYTFQF